MAQRLFDQVSINATSGQFIHNDTAQMTAFVWGRFGGASIYLEFSPDGINWFRDPTDEHKYSAEDGRRLSGSQDIGVLHNVLISVGVHVRAVIENAGPATQLSLMIL